MAKCPNCGSNKLFGQVNFHCIICGKVACSKCMMVDRARTGDRSGARLLGDFLFRTTDGESRREHAAICSTQCVLKLIRQYLPTVVHSLHAPKPGISFSPALDANERGLKIAKKLNPEVDKSLSDALGWYLIHIEDDLLDIITDVQRRGNVNVTERGTLDGELLRIAVAGGRLRGQFSKDGKYFFARRFLHRKLKERVGQSERPNTQT